ncbi:MAG: transketolase, partial [Gammaproteobacteria bacterium]|nr:transketolase [Gammaproteobacteria bacterium]
VLRDTQVDASGAPDVILIATGSEVDVAMQAAARLAESGRYARVVSMPCTDVFDAQDAAYRELALPAAVTARVAVEAGITQFWRKYVGDKGRIVGIDRFGESAPGDVVMRYFGFTAENVAMVAEQAIDEN